MFVFFLQQIKTTIYILARFSVTAIYLQCTSFSTSTQVPPLWQNVDVQIPKEYSNYDKSNFIKSVISLVIEF